MVFVESFTGKKTHLMTEKLWTGPNPYPPSLCGRRAPANGWMRTPTAEHPICEKCQKRADELSKR